MTKYLREHLRSIKLYKSARSEFSGDGQIMLDANEMPWDTGYNRYPNPDRLEFRQLLADVKGVKADQVTFANGSDQLIDYIFRAFCEPQADTVLTHDPGFAMVDFCASLNRVELKKVALTAEFDLDLDKTLEAIEKEQPKVIFLCSPNNPTGNVLSKDKIHAVIKNSSGIVVVDEAYIDFHSEGSFTEYIEEYPHLIVIQTMSKAWSHAAIRFGMLFAQAELIHDLKHVRLPYDVNALTVEKAREVLANQAEMKKRVDLILAERERVSAALENLSAVRKVHASDSNFLLVGFHDANKVKDYLQSKSIITRNRSQFIPNTLRISIGLQDENDALIAALSAYNGRD